MKKYQYFLGIIGGILAFFCFALPWDSDSSGANLANSGGDTLITIVFISILVSLISSVYVLKQHSPWNYLSIIAALIMSSIAHFLYVMFFDAFFAGILFSGFGRFVSILFIYVLVFGILSTIIYLANRSLFQEYWRLAVGLLLGSIGIISCFILILVNYDRHNIPGTTSDSGINFIIISFIASVAIVGVSIYRFIHESEWKTWSSFFVIFSSGVGICCFLFLFLGDSLDLKINSDYLTDPKYGAFLTTVGYILSMIGVLCSYETAQDVVSSDTQEQEDSPKGEV